MSDIEETKIKEPGKKTLIGVCIGLMLLGALSFLIMLASTHPERGWQSYLISFLLWSSIAQGGFLFSMVMQITGGEWGGKPLRRLAESFAAFFPISLLLFLFLFVGKSYVFPWIHEDLHGKEAWLNVWFLLCRDLLALLLLYLFGLGYLFHSLCLDYGDLESNHSLHTWLKGQWARFELTEEKCKARMNILSVLYVIAFAFGLSLIGFDLVMSMDPHWISTLFGAYTFVKAFYVGLGALAILATVTRLTQGEASGLPRSTFHDLGKLFFGFCLVWADFFYCQFIVIWYGNIPEETHYVIVRTMTAPWSDLAWTVFFFCFIFPFFLLMRQEAKQRPVFFSFVAGLVIIGIWLEHFLLIGPTISHNPQGLPLQLTDGFIFLGFFGLMILAVNTYLDIFPGQALELKGDSP